MTSQRYALTALSCFVAISVSCASGAERHVTTGAAGSTGSAGNAAAGTTGAAGDQGAAGATGAAGDQSAAGTTGAAGDQSAAGTTGSDGAAGAQGGGGTTGAAGDQGAAGQTAGDDGGAAGAAAPVCNNSAVVTAGGLESNCTAKTTWKATAMPTPPSKYKGIADTQLQPQYAIDGMTTTRYSSGMTMASGFYFQVDLGATKMVSGITVDTSEGADTLDVASSYEVELSTDGTTFTPVASCASAAAPMEVVNFKATTARYVRYTNMGGPGPANGPTSWLAIHEFDVLCN